MKTINPDDDIYSSSIEPLHFLENNSEDGDNLQTLEVSPHRQDPPEIQSSSQRLYPEKNTSDDDVAKDQEDDEFRESQDESRNATVYADMHGAISEGKRV